MIDLSHIDANITTAGVQNFTFIGSAAFTGAGGQVRYQLDPTRNVTYVQVALAGDKSADLTITLMGLLPLTAANFALTAAQSSADLAAGALETNSKVQTSGASLDTCIRTSQGGPIRRSSRSRAPATATSRRMS